MATQISPDVVLSDLSTYQYFYDQYMDIVLNNAFKLLYYRSEASILAQEHIKWDGSVYWQESDEFYINNEYYMLIDQYNGKIYASIDSKNFTAENRAACEQAAIREQLNAFRASQLYLESMAGFLYFIRDPEGNIVASSGIETQYVSLYRDQPIYFIMDGDFSPEDSHSRLYGYLYPRYYSQISQNKYPYRTDTSDDKKAIYFAFTADTVNARNIVYTEMRAKYIRDFTNITVAALLIVALLVILLLGAGRKYADVADPNAAAPPLPEGEKTGVPVAASSNFEPEQRIPIGKTVHFALIDKPYLDIAFLLLAGWIALTTTIAGQFFDPVWHHRNTGAINVLFAVGSVAIVSPALLWLMSLAKRMKAGSFWKYTLIYALPSRFFRFCVRIIKSLWAGFPLTVKVGAIAFISFCSMLFIGFLGFISRGNMILVFSLVFCAVVTYFLLRYAKRIHKLDQGVRNISGDSYGEPIDAGGGELGSIAGSINNISAGINTAVEQRMKSERLKTELITNVSHDIRTPLTSIITYADLLKHEGLDCEKAPEYLDILIQKSQRLKTLTDELFEASKAATGNIDVNISHLDIVSLINQVLGELDGAIKSSGIDLRVNLPERLSVMADGRLMWRVMENLLSNVFKYSLKGSRVYLDAVAAKQGDESTASRETGELPPCFARIDLKNISATELNVDPAELTERFKRGDDSRSEGSSGLGLSIVQSFVNAQGGKFAISIDGDLFKASVYIQLATLRGGSLLPGV